MKDLTKLVTDFRDKRDWAQFHTSSNLSKAISVEAAELLELHLWDPSPKSKAAVKDEVADIMIYCLLLADRHGFDPEKAIRDKVKKNEKRYPVSKSKGNAKKYDEL
jgi:NTP pyrophosphatase (non-canonical NTP hydrolase)